MKSIVLLKCLMTLCLSLFLSTPVWAQGIQIFVAGPAGGTLDFVARKLATKLSTNTTVLVSNTPSSNLTDAFEGLAKNSDRNLLIADVGISSATDAEMNRLKAMSQLGKVAYLFERTIEPNTKANPTNIPLRLVTGIYAHQQVQPMWSERVQQGVKAMGDEGLDYTFSGRYVVAFNHTANALTVANAQLLTQPSVPNASANIPATAAPIPKNVDDAVQTGRSDAPLSTEATGKINISAGASSERTRYTPAQMPQGLNPTNLNVYNDLPTTMMGVRVNNILERTKSAQDAVDQDRRGTAKRHVAAAAAHQCLKLIKEPRMYGGLTNTCNYAVEFNFCLYHPEKDSWGAMFDCEQGNGSGGSWQVGPLKNVALHTNGAERVHWFACRWGETLGKPNGVSPADVHFDGGRMMGRCSTWGRETERYNSASASQPVQQSVQRPAGAAQQTNSASTSTSASASTASTQTGSQASKSTSSQQLAGGTGKWPAGVEPGNLYIVKTGQNVMLISARSKTEAQQQYERAFNALRDEALKPFYAQGGAAGRANLAVHEPSYRMDYQVTQECLGANWGAVVSVSDGGSLGGTGAACGARTPAEAIVAAFEVCSRQGYNCNREGTRSPTPIIVIAHSGAKSWQEPEYKPMFSRSSGAGVPLSTLYFTSLSATTYQMNATVIDYVQGPNEAIASFGKACGKKAHARDIYSCWITSRNLACINSSPINPQDRMPMQQTCIDMKLTKDGYLP